MDPDSTPMVVTVERAARLLDCSPATIIHWIRTGRLQAFKAGRGYRIKPADLEAILEPAGRSR